MKKNFLSNICPIKRQHIDKKRYLICSLFLRQLMFKNGHKKILFFSRTQFWVTFDGQIGVFLRTWLIKMCLGTFDWVRKECTQSNVNKSTFLTSKKRMYSIKRTKTDFSLMCALQINIDQILNFSYWPNHQKTPISASKVTQKCVLENEYRWPF